MDYTIVCQLEQSRLGNMLDQGESQIMVTNLVRDIADDNSLEITGDTSLIGEARALDSLGLVELCLRLEELAATYGFDFDWTSSSAMSVSNSMFRTVNSLAQELAT